ncbi:MAG: phage portal protein, partial [Oligoflexales bacterium]
MEKIGNLWLPYNANAYKQVSPSNKAMMGWDLPGVSDVDNQLLPALGALQATSTDLQRNDPLAGGFLRNLVNGTISLGLQPEPIIDHKFLGITQKQADKFTNDAELLWGIYSSSLEADYTRRKTFWGMEKQVCYSKALFGNVFGIRKFRDDGIFGSCVQLVEDHRVQTPPDKPDADNIIDGIEFDEDTGEPVKIWVRKKKFNKSELEEDFEGVPVLDEDGIKQILHIKRDDERIGGTKGVPLLNNITTLLKQTGRYTEAEAEASVINAFIAFYTTAEGGFSPTSSPANRGLKVGEKPGYPPPPSEIRSGQTYNLAPGESINQVTPGRPNPSAETFLMAMIKFMSCYLQIPYEVLLGVYNSSYSASRAAIMQSYRLYQKERQDLALDFHNYVWEWFISECVARGLLRAPGFFK